MRLSDHFTLHLVSAICLRLVRTEISNYALKYAYTKRRDGEAWSSQFTSY